MSYSYEFIKEIIERIDKGENLKNIALELRMNEEYLRKIIREKGFKYSKKLGMHYHKDYHNEVIQQEPFERCMELWFKRYKGIDTKNHYGDIPRDEYCSCETIIIESELSIQLANELIQEAEERVLPVSLIIEEKLLDQLEKNRPTTDNKLKDKYIDTMCEYAHVFRDDNEKIETLKEMKDNISKYSIKFTYKDIWEDIDTYKRYYLMAQGYSLEQVSDLVKDIDLLEEHYRIQKESGGNMNYEDVESEI
ncbi:hypothetical protein [uncultured Clostridium sp.]|uniref:hypothetical protein n=1 Tax=uncultured Clostridium sp. TaxID=59620 RepID=UPI0025F84816|nr:hypothetical protein [uncultured Clostridium sp.]